MSTLVTETSSPVKLEPGSFIIDVYDRQYWDPEYYKVILKEQGPKFREFALQEMVHYNFNETTGVITFTGDYGEVRIEYQEPLDLSNYGVGAVPQNKVNSDVKRSRKLNVNETNIVEDQQANKISNEGSIIGNFNEVNGFISLSSFSKEGEAITKKIMPVKLTSSAGDGSLKSISTNVSKLTNIFGEAPVADATGTLKKIITSGAPQSLMKQMQKNFSSLPIQKIRTYASNISISPSTTIESLKPEKDPSRISIETVSKIYKDKLKLKLNSGGFDLNPLGAFPGLGRSKQNLAGQFIGSILNKIGSFFGNILSGIKVFDNPTPTITDSFGGNVKDLIEVGGARTNISNYMTKGNLVDIKPPKIEYVLQDQNAFLGYATPETYKFTFVNSTEELITEFKQCSRGPTSTSDDAIGGLFVYATKKFTGPPEKANAEALQNGVKDVFLRIVTKEIEETNSAAEGKTAAETALDRISINPNEYGINSHYLILTDGSLQRGRPIDKPRSSVSHPRFSKTGIQLSFISGGKIPNSKMFETYDRFLKAWFTVFPDCGVYDNNEANPEDSPNLFDVRQSVISKYNFVYRYDDLSEFDEFPTKVERVITKPKTVAITSSTISKPISFAEANKRINDLVESKQFNNDFNSAINKAGATLSQLNGEDRDSIAIKYGAENLESGDLKAKMDADYKIFQNGMKEKNKELNNIIGKLNTNDRTVKSFGFTLNRSK